LERECCPGTTETPSVGPGRSERPDAAGDRAANKSERTIFEIVSIEYRHRVLEDREGKRLVDTASGKPEAKPTDSDSLYRPESLGTLDKRQIDHELKAAVRDPNEALERYDKASKIVELVELGKLIKTAMNDPSDENVGEVAKKGFEMVVGVATGGAVLMLGGRRAGPYATAAGEAGSAMARQYVSRERAVSAGHKINEGLKGAFNSEKSPSRDAGQRHLDSAFRRLRDSFDGPFARVRFLTSAYGRKTYLSERET
jgi:hypothetical protein